VIAVVIVLAVLVVVLGAWLYGTRHALREARALGDELNGRLEVANHDVERAMADVAETKSKFEAERERASAATQRAEASAKEAEKSDAVARAATERALALERRALDAGALWALEAIRFDRMWRDHAAVGPNEPSPLADTSDPARAAIEIVAEALREDSGTTIEVQWKADEVAAPAPAARLVRACEELLATARSVDNGVIEVHRGDVAGSFVVRVRTEPVLDAPDHVLAALEAAGLDPKTENDVVEVRVAPADPESG
jgi:hypothetical protein